MLNDAALRLDRKSAAATLPPRRLLGALAIIIGLILLLGGYRKMTDTDLPAFLIQLAHGKAVAINPSDGFKFEGILADAGLYLLGKLDIGPDPTALLFWAMGLVAVAGAVAWELRDGSIGAPALLLAVAFTRLVDTFSMWIGKTDPWLVAFLVLSASRAPWVSRFGMALAAFVHPLIAVLSALGMLAIDAYYDRKPRWADAALALVATGVALLLFRMLFPTIQGRGGYMIEQLVYVGLRGIEDGLPSIVTDIVAPVAALLVLAGFERGRNPLFLLAVLAWLSGVAVLTSFLTLDHTRDACLITFAATLVWLRHQEVRVGAVARRATIGTFAALFASRLVIPHYDQDGAHIFRWPPITRWSEPLIGRIFEADKAQCESNPLRCVYHRNPAPEIRVPTL